MLCYSVLRHSTFVFFIMCGCSQAKAHTKPQWSEESVVGLTMSLDDPAVEEDFSFGKNGFVGATFGRKGGPLTGPALRWRLVDGYLQIGEGQTAEQFALVARDSSTIIVTNRVGKTLRFRIVQQAQ